MAKEPTTYPDGDGREWVWVEDTETGHHYAAGAGGLEDTQKVLDESPFVGGVLRAPVPNLNVGTAKKAVLAGNEGAK